MNVINIARSSVAGFSRRRVSLAQLLEREIEHIGMKEKRRRDSPAGLRHPTAREPVGNEPDDGSRRSSTDDPAWSRLTLPPMLTLGRTDIYQPFIVTAR